MLKMRSLVKNCVLMGCVSQEVERAIGMREVPGSIHGISMLVVFDDWNFTGHSMCLLE